MHQRFSFASESASAQRSRLMGRSSFAAPALKKKKRKLLVVQVEDPPNVVVQQQPVFAAHIREESASLSPQVVAVSEGSSSNSAKNNKVVSEGSSSNNSAVVCAASFAATVADSQLQFTPFVQSQQEDEEEGEKDEERRRCESRRVAIDGDDYIVRYTNFCPFPQKRLAMRAIAAERQIWNDEKTKMEKKNEEGNRRHWLVPLWGRQTSEEGGQSFVLANYAVFWRHYAAMQPQERVFYEMVQADTMVKCFADYDSSVEDMTAAQFASNVDLLNQVVTERLRALFQVHVSGRVLTLSSSSSSKHSRHCIWEMEGVMFENVAHLKAFMFMCGNEAHARFPSRTAEGSKKIFGILDMSVYKAGAYRLYGSTKLGQDRFLVDESGAGKFNPSEEVFLRSLVQRFVSVRTVLRCHRRDGDNGDGDVAALLRRGGAKRNRDAALRTRTGINSLPLEILRKVLQMSEQSRLSLVCRRWALAVNGCLPGRPCGRSLVQRVLLMLRRDFGHLGEFKEEPLEYVGVFGRCLIFGQKSQECELSYQANGRKHKKNSIYWVVFPDLGVFYQKCHDAECKLRILKGSAQPPLEDCQLVFTDSSCLLRNSLLDVQCHIALEGRGQVRLLPHEVLFARVENVRSGAEFSDARHFVVRSLSANTETVFKLLDLVTWKNDVEQRVWLAKSWDSNGRLMLVPFVRAGGGEALAEAIMVGVGAEEAGHLRLVGGAFYQKQKSGGETRRVLARVRRAREMSEMIVQQGDVVLWRQQHWTAAGCAENMLLLLDEGGRSFRCDPKEVLVIGRAEPLTQPKTQPMN